MFTLKRKLATFAVALTAAGGLSGAVVSSASADGNLVHVHNNKVTCIGSAGQSSGNQSGNVIQICGIGF
jgi:hypothetical protein